METPYRSSADAGHCLSGKKNVKNYVIIKRGGGCSEQVSDRGGEGREELVGNRIKKKKNEKFIR